MTVPSKGRQWKRCGIYCIYAKYGHVARYVDYFLSKLVKSLDQLVIVANGELDADSRKRLERFADRIIVRENKGLDIAAYRQALLSIGWSKLAAYDEVICLNDTILGPVFPFSEMFETMDGKNVDFWGITAYPHDVAFGEEIPTHLQSYWHAYRKSLITSKAFQRYWETMPVYEDYAEATRKHEMTFTKRFADLGFTWASYIDYDKYRSRSTYPMLYDPVSLIRDDRCPVFKKRSFFVEYQYYFNQTAGQPGMELLEYLRRHTDYDTDLIWDAVLPAYNIADIAKAVHLNYVLPTRTVNPREDGDAPVRSAFIYHVYFLDLLDQTLGYLANLPEDTDLYITTNESKIDDIRKAMDKRGFTHTVDFIPVQNRGRDVSALLVGAKDVVLGGKYDVVGFAHDKKSGQNQQNGHQGTETEGFAYKLLENTLGSKDYVRNILTLFANNPRLGMATPPPPIHALYFAHTVPHDWGINFDITKDLLENKLHIHVPLDERKPSVSAIGSCYWFRVEALKPLYEYGWRYEDFLPEGKMGVDGTISHAIERANGYIAQSQGYYPAWVMSDKYARIEVDSLYYTAQGFMDTTSGVRRGESVMESLGSLRSSLTFVGRLRRTTHLALGKVFRAVTYPLPKPMQSRLRKASWVPIRTAYAVLKKVRSGLHR